VPLLILDHGIRREERNADNGTKMNSTDTRSHVIELESTIKSTMKLRQRRARHDGLVNAEAIRK
jgi:hypothetical protein